MGITRSNRHKRKKTGGRKGIHEKKRKNNSGRQPANTKIGDRKVRPVRVRGGNIKLRALRLNEGTFSSKTHNFTVNTKILQVMYHPSNNELVRTNTLTRSAVVKLDAEDFKDRFEDLKDVDPVFYSNLENGDVYGIITTRPGQVGQISGYLLQGPELEFYYEKFKNKNVMA